MSATILPWRQPTATPQITQVIPHTIVRDTGVRLHRECIGRGLSTVDADNVLGLYRTKAREVGHIRAYDIATRRAIQLAPQHPPVGPRKPDPPPRAA